MLYCAMLYYAMLYCAMLYCAMLYYAILCYAILCYAIMCHAILCYAILSKTAFPASKMTIVSPAVCNVSVHFLLAFLLVWFPFDSAIFVFLSLLLSLFCVYIPLSLSFTDFSLFLNFSTIALFICKLSFFLLSSFSSRFLKLD